MASVILAEETNPAIGASAARPDPRSQRASTFACTRYHHCPVRQLIRPPAGIRRLRPLT